jgi:hypothetical protein
MAEQLAAGKKLIGSANSALGFEEGMRGEEKAVAAGAISIEIIAIPDTADPPMGGAPLPATAPLRIPCPHDPGTP